jgi:polysaccharide export outer membrane protein
MSPRGGVGSEATLRCLSGFAYNHQIKKYKGLREVFAKVLLAAAVAVAGILCNPGAVHAQEAGYMVKPGDGLEISVWKEPDLQGPVLVTPDGSFSFPLVGQVDARGKTVTDLQQVITERLAKFISDPVVTVSVREIRGNKVYVIGQVNRPGEFIVNPRVDVMQALSMAGGTTAFAALDDIRILRRAGTKQESLEFDYNAVARGKALEQNIELRAGDIVVVP